MAWVCGLLFAWDAGLNPAEGMNVCPLCLLCVVQVATCWSLVHRSPTGPIWTLHHIKKRSEEFAGQMKRNFWKQ
jgi:hypothetical protein